MTDVTTHEAPECIHDVLARYAYAFAYRGIAPERRGRLMRRQRYHDDPRVRIQYCRTIGGAWLALAVACTLLFVPGLFSLLSLPLLTLAVVLCCFCAAGAFAAAWWEWVARIAVHRARVYGMGSEQYHRVMDRARPSQSSVPFQILAALVAGAIALTAL